MTTKTQNLGRPLGRRAWQVLLAASAVCALSLAGCDKTGESAQSETTEAGTAQTANVDDRGSSLVTTSPDRSRLAPPTPVTFDPPEVDFGLIEPFTDAEASVRITNITDGPVRITNVATTCKCTTVNDLEGTVLQPGETTKLDAVVEGRATPGPRTVKVRFIFDTHPDQPFEVVIRGEVSLPIRARPAYINTFYREVADTDPNKMRGMIRVEAVDGRTFRILAANRKPPVYSDDFDPEIDEPRNTYFLEYDLTSETYQSMPMYWMIETDREDCPLVDVYVRHKHTMFTRWDPANVIRSRVWKAKERRLLVGNVKRGDTAQIDVTVADIITQRSLIESVRTDSEEVDIELVSFEADGNDGICRLRITPRPGHTGMFYAMVRLQGKRFNAPMFIIGRVVD